MAEVLLKYACLKLGSSLVEERSLLLSFPDQAGWIEEEYNKMKKYLRQESDSTSSKKKRLGFIQYLAKESEAIIDVLEFKREHDQRSRGSRRLSRIGGVPILLTLVRKIKNIRERISSIEDLYAIDPTPDAIVGLEEHKEMILNQLLHRHSGGEEEEEKQRRRTSMVVIVGVLGIGKTTLASVVYESEEAKEYFEVRLWVNAYDHNNMFRILKEMLGSVNVVPESELETLDYEVVEEKLLEYLKERRYLIVYDGLEDRSLGDALRKFLPDARNGSRVVITTRLSTYNSGDDNTFIYPLPLLNSDDSFKLLCKNIMYPPIDHMRSCDEAKREICKHLAWKTEGLPSALVTFGRFLSNMEMFSKLSPENVLLWVPLCNYLYELWMEYSEAMITGRPSFDLLGSLPQHLKQCLLYLVAVPGDSQIQVGKLVRLWIAEGFIPEVQEEEEILEETAENFLQQLIQRSLIEVVSQRKKDRTPRTCRLLRGLREYYVGEARQMIFLHVDREEKVGIEFGVSREYGINRLAYFGMDRMRNALTNAGGEPCTLIGFNLHSNEGPLDCAPITRFELLRVVDLEDAPLKKLPEEIGNLVLLRYLGLRNTNLEELPASLGKLLLLQTLDIRSTFITRLPQAFWRIRRLRHIFLGWNTVCPSRIDKLEDLQTLRNVAAGRWISRGLSRKSIRNLKIYDFLAWHTSKLWEMLQGLSRLTSLSLKGEVLHAGLMNFSAHERLHTLDLGGPFGMNTLLEANEFPQNLTKLTLRKSGLVSDPMEILMQLQSLRVLRLSDAYEGNKMVCTRGGFSNLQHLVLGRLRKLESWIVEDGAMPKLEFLCIVSCNSLTHLPEGLQHLRSLNKIDLVDMPANFTSRVQKFVGEDWPKIQHVPIVDVRKVVL